MTGLAASLRARFAAARARYHWLDHILRSWAMYKSHHGDHFAAAVTFFSFLSLFPLILLAVSVAGFVLRAHPSLQQDLFTSISDNVPGSFGDTLSESIDQAIQARTSVGIVGLVGVLFTGLGWVANLRAAIEGVWGQTPAKRPFLKAKAADLLVLIGLGLGAVLSLGLTAVGATLTSTVLGVLGLDDIPGLFIVTKIIGIALALAGDMLIFGWLLVRLPQADVPRGVGLRAAILAAVGFEVLKLAGTFFITRATQSATAGVFASVIGILVWINLVSRFLLFCAAWTSTAAGTVRPDQDKTRSGEHSLAGPEQVAPEAATGAVVSPAATAAVLVGAGAVVGVVATLGAARWWQLGRR